MKIDTSFQEDHQVKLTVEIEQETLEGSKRRAAKQIAKKVKIPGFRPGKAPYDVIQKHVSEATILENALELIIDDIYPKAIEESEIKPYGPGSLENFTNEDPPIFEFTVPLLPEVKLEDIRKLRINYEKKEVKDEDINQVIDNLRENQAIIEPADRKIEEGDMVYIVLSGERKGEEDESKKTLIEERRYPVIIEKEGVDQKSEYPYPGFSRELIGLTADDEKTLEFHFADDYEFDKLQGITGLYNIKIEEVKARSLPELNDEFVKSVGDYEDLDGMREDISKTLSERFENERNAEYEDQIIKKLLNQVEIKYPPQMLEHEIDHFIEDLERQLAQQGLDIDLYKKSRDIEIEELREEVKPNAEERMKRGLIIMEVAEQEEISLTQEEIEEKTQQTLTEIKQMYSEQEVKKFTQPQVLERLVNRIITDEIISRTLERLRIIAKGEKIPEKVDNAATEKETNEETPKDIPQENVESKETEITNTENEDD